MGGVHYNGGVCRAAEDTSTCVGQVQYFVKATPCTDEAMSALRALGIPSAVQRFAIVDAYRAEDVQTGLEVDVKDSWFKTVSKALKSAGLVKKDTSFSGLLNEVKEMSTVLAVGHRARVTLTQRTAQSGTLCRLAIPLSSNSETWYHKEGAACTNWSVHPMVRIDPRKERIGPMDLPTGDRRRTMQAAIKRVQETKLYFVHTFSKSNNKMWKHL